MSTPNDQQNDLSLALLQGLIEQCEGTTEALIENLAEDALYWKLEYIKLAENLIKTCAAPTAEYGLMNVLLMAQETADIARHSVNQSEAIH